VFFCYHGPGAIQGGTYRVRSGGDLNQLGCLAVSLGGDACAYEGCDHFRPAGYQVGVQVVGAGCEHGGGWCHTNTYVLGLSKSNFWLIYFKKTALSDRLPGRAAVSLAMRVLTVADLHQRRALYEQLAAAVALHKPDVVALVGDFLDGWVPPPAGVDLISAIDAALALAALPCEVVLIRGNHETETNWPDFELAWRATGRPLHALHGSAVNVGGLEIVGFPCWTGNDSAYAETRPLRDYRADAWLGISTRS